MDDEINRAIAYVVKGFEVNEETLSVKFIEEVGSKGNYFTHPSTFTHCKDLMSPSLMYRETYESWTSKGETSLHERAFEKAKSVVEKHRPDPISSQGDDRCRQKRKNRWSFTG